MNAPLRPKSYRPLPGGESHPLVRRLFTECGRRGIPIAQVARRSGISRQTIYSWQDRDSPNLPNIIACLNAIGLELVVAPLRERGDD